MLSKRGRCEKMDKDMKKLLKAAEEQGFEWYTRKNGHIVVTLNGKFITEFGGTPGDKRSWLNSLAPLKRNGFQWPPTK